MSDFISKYGVRLTTIEVIPGAQGAVRVRLVAKSGTGVYDNSMRAMDGQKVADLVREHLKTAKEMIGTNPLPVDSE